MSAFGNYLETALLNHIFRTDYSRPANVYVALYTAAPSDAGGGTEVSGDGYARVATDTGTSGDWSVSGDTAENNINIEFAEAEESWGTVVAVGLFDAATDGNLLFHSTLTAPREVPEGAAPRFPAGDLTITLD